MEEDKKVRGGNPQVKKELEEDKVVENIESEIKNVKPLEKNDIKKDKKKLDKRIIIIIVVFILAIIITSVLIYFKIKSLNEKYKYIEKEDNVFETENKIEDTELAYIINDDDRININDIIIDKKYYANGQFYDEHPGGGVCEIIQISGLKNKDVENSINARIMDKVNEYIENGDFQVRIIGNFSNILSLLIQNYYSDGNIHYYAMNIDLNTGNDIKFEDLFLKSTPIYSILYNGFIRFKSWDYDVNYDDYASDEEYWNAVAWESDMNNRDTSQYEDYLYKIIEEYNKNKDNLIFTIGNSSIEIYGFDMEGNYNLNNISYKHIEIPIYEYKDYVTLFKKYATANLYENDVAIDGIRPFYKNESYYYSNNYKSSNIYYETDNLLVDVFIDDYEKYFYKQKECANYVINSYIEMANNDKENFYIIQSLMYNEFNQDSYYINYYNEYYIPNYHLYPSLSIVKIPMEYKDEINEILSSFSNTQFADDSTRNLTSYKSRIKNDERIILVTQSVEYPSLYFDIDGNYIGDQRDCIVDKTKTNNQYGQS